MVKNDPKKGFFLYFKKICHWFLLESHLDKNWYYYLFQISYLGKFLFLRFVLFWIWNNLYHLRKSVSFSEAADHPAASTKINVPPQMFLCFIIRQMVPSCKIHHICFFLHFQETLSLDFLEMNFPKIARLFWSLFCEMSCLGKGLVVELWIRLSYWPIRLHAFSKFSFSLTTLLFGMVIIDIPSVLY